jgi:hypothetical protein
MLLALLMLVVGRLGGALGGPPPVMLAPDADRDMGGARGGSPRLSVEGAALSSGVPGGGTDLGGPVMLPPDTDLEASRDGGGGVPDIGGGVAVAARGPPLGGGGVAFLASTFSAPGFLLTQRFRSGS